MGTCSALQRIRTAGVFLALFALTFKAMLPPGYMLKPAANHILVTPCGGGEVLLEIDSARVRRDGEPRPSNDGDEKQHCPFAQFGAPTLVTSEAS